MESHGLAAHAAAPLAMCELVARLCLGPPRDDAAPPLGLESAKRAGDGASPPAGEPKAKAGKGKGASSSKGGGGAAGGAKGQDKSAAEQSSSAQGRPFPALALACLRRSRLLLKLGPT